MKRIIALVLALTLAAGLAAAETAQEAETPTFFDMTYYEANDKYFLIDIQQDGDTVTINSGRFAENPEYNAFSTPYEREPYLSVIFPDITVMNYPREQEREAAFRIRIVYNGTKPLNIHSATFTGGGYTYAFSDIAFGSAPESDGVCTETMTIVGGSGDGNVLFLANLMAEAYGYAAKKYASEDKETVLPDWTLVLHGDEDVAVELPEGFWSDVAMLTTGLMEMNTFSFLTRNPGSPCEIAEVK